MANTLSLRVRNVSAIWRGVAPCFVAIACNTFPPGEDGEGKRTLPERTIGNDSDAVFLAPGNDGVFDRALAHMIEHLIAGDLTFAGDAERFLEIVLVEVAYAPGADFAGAL